MTITTKIAKNDSVIVKVNGERKAIAIAAAIADEAAKNGEQITISNDNGNIFSYKAHTEIVGNTRNTDGTYRPEIAHVFQTENGELVITHFNNSDFADIIRAIARNSIKSCKLFTVEETATVEPAAVEAETETTEEPAFSARQSLETRKHIIMAELGEYREGLIEAEEDSETPQSHIDYLKDSIDRLVAEYYDVCRQLDDLDEEPATTKVIIPIVDYRTLLTWAEKVSNGQHDTAIQIVTHIKKWFNADTDKKTVIEIIKADDLNGFRNFISQFNFAVKDDGGYIHKLYRYDNGECVLAEIPSSEYAQYATESTEPAPVEETATVEAASKETAPATETVGTETENATVETKAENKDDEITIADLKVFSAKLRGLSFAEFVAEQQGLTVAELAEKEKAENLKLARRELSWHVREQELQIRDLEYDLYQKARCLYGIFIDNDFVVIDESLRSYAAELETEYNEISAKIATCKEELATVEAAITADKYFKADPAPAEYKPQCAWENPHNYETVGANHARNVTYITEPAIADGLTFEELDRQWSRYRVSNKTFYALYTALRKRAFDTTVRAERKQVKQALDAAFDRFYESYRAYEDKIAEPYYRLEEETERAKKERLHKVSAQVKAMLDAATDKAQIEDGLTRELVKRYEEHEANQPAEVKELNAELAESNLQAPCMWVRIVGGGVHCGSFARGVLNATRVDYDEGNGYGVYYFDEPMELYDTFAQAKAAVDQFKAAITTNAESFTFPTVEDLTPEPTDRDKFLRASKFVVTLPGRYLGTDKFGNDRFVTKWFSLCPYEKISKAKASVILAQFGLTPDAYLAERNKWAAEEVARGMRQFSIDRQAEFLREKIAADSKASVEPVPVFIPVDNDTDDDELIDPPESNKPGSEACEVAPALTPSQIKAAKIIKLFDGYNMKFRFADNSKGTTCNGKPANHGLTLFYEAEGYENDYITAFIEHFTDDTSYILEAVTVMIDGVSYGRFEFDTEPVIEYRKTKTAPAKKTISRYLSPTAKRYLNRGKAREEARERKARRDWQWEMEQRFYPN